MNRAVSLVASCLLGGVAAAQGAQPFPLNLQGVDAATGVARLAPSLERIAALEGRDAVVLTGVALPGLPAGASLALERIPHERFGFAYRVDGRPAPDLLDGAALSVWKGAVVGDPASEVLLSFSTHGTRGWIRAGGELVHLMPQPGAGGDWLAGPVLAPTQRELEALGARPDFRCGTETAVAPTRADGLPLAPHGQSAAASAEGGSTVLYGCSIALESDFQLNQVFGGSLTAETAYVTTLWSAVADRYLEQVEVLLSFPYVQFYTTPADPWSTPDFGGDSGTMLNEFLSAWQGSIPAGAEIGHMLSGANLGGGIAYLSVLCDDADDFSFAVSGNLDGQVPFPIAVSPLNWDFMVTAHETGHNFGSPHSHDYVPPLDQCAFGVCIPDGTLMSYCHLCPGGLINITTYFHPMEVAVIKAHVADCLDVLVGIQAAPPALIAPGAPTPLSASVDGQIVGPVLLNYRFAPSASFASVPMSPAGGGAFVADLPAAQCGDQPELFFSFTDASVGPIATDVFTPEVGLATTLFHDDLETDLGWLVGVPGDDATSGIWVRADPIGTDAQPSTGVPIGGGTNCWFTGQGPAGGSIGDNDVDGGKTTLRTPAFDLAGKDARIGYWRWYSNTGGSSPGADVFEVEITANGTTWVDVETVGPTGPEADGGWVYHELVVSDFVTPSANVRLRFVASDEGSGSIVEAAVDELSVFEVECGVCQDDLGFGGPGAATLSICGDALAPGGTAMLSVQGGPPGGVVAIGYGTSFNPTPLFGGTLVPIPVANVGVLVLDGAGSKTFPVMGGAPSALTLYVQGVIPSGGSFLITNAVAADYLP